MPMYNWCCKVCGAKVSILRPHDEHRSPPTKEEIDKEATGLKPDCPHTEWDKLIGAPKMVRGASWGGAKGYW